MKKIISGKVREVYEVSDDQLVIVTTDRISAFDVILPKPVPGKGKIVNAVSLLWFDYTKDIVPNHVLSSDLSDMPACFQKEELEGRAILAKKLQILPFEFIVRGYMFGNMWESYRKSGSFCGHSIEGNYQLAEKLAAPLFTPSTKAHQGHDEYVSIEAVADAVGKELTEKIKEISLKLYKMCYNNAYAKGIIIADTKFEFGLDQEHNLILADEIGTPDSSRFWSLADYEIGISPKSYDKQLLRDWLLNHKDNDKTPDDMMAFDKVPDAIYEKTADIYQECLRRLQNG